MSIQNNSSIFFIRHWNPPFLRYKVAWAQNVSKWTKTSPNISLFLLENFHFHFLLSSGLCTPKIATRNAERINQYNKTEISIYYKRSVLLRQSRDTNRNIKRSVYCRYERDVSLWRRANARNVRLYYPYRQYTNLFMFWFGKWSNCEMFPCLARSVEVLMHEQICDSTRKA